MTLHWLVVVEDLRDDLQDFVPGFFLENIQREITLIAGPWGRPLVGVEDVLSLEGEHGSEVSMPDRVAEVGHLGELHDLLVGAGDVVSDPLDPLQVGVFGVAGEVGQVKIIWPKRGRDEEFYRGGSGDEDYLT